MVTTTQPRTWTLTVMGQLWTHNAERNRHWAWRAGRVDQWRHDAFWVAKGAAIPRLATCHVAFRFEQARGRLADTGAHEPPAKAVLDGLVDAGVLDDDTGTQVLGIMFCPPTRSPDRVDRIHVTITEGAPWE